MNEAQNQSKLPRSTEFGSHTVCEIHTYLFYLLTQKQLFKRGGKTNQYFLRREFGSERFMLLYYLHSGCWGTFAKDNSNWLTFHQSSTISNSHHRPPAQLLTLETECWNDVLHNKGYLAHTQLIAHKPIVTYLYTKYCSHIVSCYSHRK